MKRVILNTLFALACVQFTSFNSQLAQAQSVEERFQDVFTTAGYATAFGAALGAAALSLTPRPERNLQYIAVGASLGFIGGSVLGAYMVLSPMVAMENGGDTSIAMETLPAKGIVVRPVFDANNRELSSISAGATLLNF